jgi:hypothetical protein
MERTPYQSNAHYCYGLRQNTKRQKIRTKRRIIYAAFQCRARSYRTTSKPTKNRHNLQQRNTTTRIAYLALERETAKVGLNINEQKTKYMIAVRKDRTIRDVGQSMTNGGKHLKVVKEFVYLGSVMTPTNDVGREIHRRIQTANRCFFGLRKHLRSIHLSRQTKFTVHKKLIRLCSTESFFLPFRF